MKKTLLSLAASLALSSLISPSAQAGGVIGVSWRHFQEERWRIDEAGIKDELAKLGADWKYVSADAQSDPQKQLGDVEGLLAQGAKALILLAQDANTIGPAIARAKADGVPVVAYDAPIDSADVFFVSFDNVAVGRLMAKAMVAAQPKGNWALIKGDAVHSIVNVFEAGQMEVLKPLIDKGDIKIAAAQNVENWKPDVAQSTMEQILTANNNKIDAVLAMNDGMAGGVVAALAAQGLAGIPVSGQDGDKAALNRIARASKPYRFGRIPTNSGAPRRVAVALASGKEPKAVEGAVDYAPPAASTSPRSCSSPRRSPATLSIWCSTPSGSTRPRCARA
ncbi:MAG: substrate-binding domain-containing protein [Gammaproteobacteria bacterium]